MEIPSSVTHIGYGAFRGCSSLSSVEIPSSVTSIESDTFYNCSSLSSVKIPSGVTSIGDSAFYNCSSLSSVEIPSGVTSIGNYEFFRCSSLSSVEIPSGVTSIGDSAFYYCSSLSSVEIPSGVTSIGDSAFYHCSSLSSVKIPSGVTSIEEWSFSDCHSLSSVEIPSSVTSIGMRAFNDCYKLSKISILNPDCVINDIDDGIGRTISRDTVIYGYDNSTAQSYAKKYNRKFISLGTAPEIPDDDNLISDFKIDIFKTGALNNTVTIFGTLILSDKAEVSSDILQKEVANIIWTSSDSSIVEVTGCIGDNSVDNRSAALMISIMSKKKGTVTITGTTSNGLTASCSVTISDLGEDDKGEDDNEIDYSFHNIQVYSSFPNCMIGVEQTCAILPVMAKDDDIIKNEKGWNFKVENNNIAEIQEYINTDFGTATRVVGKSAGTTKLHITHIPTGKTIDVPIFVNENTIVYNLSDVIALGEKKGVRNSGIYTTNYIASARKNGGYDISFDAYNGCSLEGAVEIYNSENQLIKVRKIDKFDRYQTGVEEVFKDGWNLVCSYVDGTIDSYTNSLYTKHTHIDEFFVPEGGYIIITNNMIDSLSVNIFNTIDIAFWMYATVKDITAEPTEEVKDDTKLKIREEVISRIIGSGEYKDAATKFQKKLADSISEKISIDTITSFTMNLLNESEVFFSDLDINLLDEFIKAMKSTGISIAKDIFKDYSGPSGKVLDMIFQSNAYLNRIMQVVDIIRTSNSKGVRIDVSAENKLISNDIIVENSDGSKFTNTDLIVVDITEEETSTYIIYLNSVSQVKIYNISLYQDNIIIQPENKIRLKVPLPATYNKDKCIIYRVEEDNSLTDMNAIYSDGYLVFETDHLSNYILYEKFSYSVTFDGNGASSGSMISLNDCLKDIQYVLPTNNYTRNNYKFNGWNTSQDGTGISFANGCTISNLAEINDENIVLYAQWTKSSNNSGNIDKTENDTEADKKSSEDDFDSNSKIINTIIQPVGKWIKDSIGWWYKNADGSYPANRWQFINNKWYFFNKAGYMVTGWILSNNKWYYLDTDGAMLEDSWVFYKNHWYFLKGGNGDMATGWILWKNQWYYLNADGSMKTGWLLDKDIWYYLNENGDMAVNCTTPDGYRVGSNGAWLNQ